MLGLQKLFEEALQQLLAPKSILTFVLEKKLKAIGIVITDGQREDFKKQFGNSESCILHFSFSDVQIRS